MNNNILGKLYRPTSPDKSETNYSHAKQPGLDQNKPYVQKQLFSPSQLRGSSLLGSNSKHNGSNITLEQENELRGEISHCKEEVDFLKHEIRKFNEVLKSKIGYGCSFKRKSRRGSKRKRSRSRKYSDSYIDEP